MNKYTEKLLKLLNITTLKDAYNIREDGKSIKRFSTKNIIIESHKNKPGLKITIKKNTKNENLYIPVIITKENIEETVYNDFYIEDNVEVNIIAGCAIHNDGEKTSIHKGVHTFYVGNNSKITYTEEHLGNINNLNNKIIDNTTNLNINENSTFNMFTIQKGGVYKSKRLTNATIEKNSNLNINEKLIISNEEEVNSLFNINLNGKKSSLKITSKTIAKDNSYSTFNSNVIGNNECFGHIECDAIIMDKATVTSLPAVTAKNKDANLTHEAAIGKIAKEEIEKLMTLGLSPKEAENTIINSFIN